MKSMIHKFEISITDRSEFRTHHVLRWLSVDVQRERPVIWAVVDVETPLRQVTVLVRGTGHAMTGDEGRHLGTIQLDGGSLIFHVFLPIGTPQDRIGTSS